MAQTTSHTLETTVRDLANGHPTPQTQTPFTIHPSITGFNVPLNTFIQNSPLTTDSSKPIPIHAIATGAILISPNNPTDPSQPRVLLLRRAPHDSMPNLWEVPGGAVDSTDPTILSGVARELHEEASLTATAVGPLVGSEVGQFFLSRSGKLVAKFHFLVEVEGANEVKVRCDPAEHSEWLWAGEGDVEREMVGGREMKFTTREQRAVVLEGFRVWKELRKGKGNEGESVVVGS